MQPGRPLHLSDPVHGGGGEEVDKAIFTSRSDVYVPPESRDLGISEKPSVMGDGMEWGEGG